MLKIQKLLRKHGFDKVVSKYDLKTTAHADGRVIFNYDQIKSPKYKPAVRECRGLVLEAGSWNLVARAFPRFFNLGEHRESDNKFDWSNCDITEKCDGSLLLVYFYNGTWHVNTRGSFGSGEVNQCGLTWRQIFDMAAPNAYYYLNERFTYVFELCSPFNKVVRYYPNACVYLLSIFEGEVERRDALLAFHSAAFPLPEVYHATSADEAAQIVEGIARANATHEGVVACDVNGNRLKIKSAEYVRLHRIASNGNIANNKDLMDIILNGEIDEVLTYWPELGPNVSILTGRLEVFQFIIDKAYNEHKDIESQKDFALSISNLPYKHLLFAARKEGELPSEVLLRLSPERVLECMGL